ncbi:DEAD/DEAH box RNA helicase family protein [Prunus dulcis]|uniref:DEAD/DEAH box RNA helicase family protein n=1 Tax=Prunus dulcis TaxID=3755 RepID=A0A4Y1QVY3_PRUDU|nr:DEAD/DEAH box RNA helicase family protein [Prunus dulcis]
MCGKIVFAAPSRPLVVQQIQACHNIVGISQEWTIDMTGQISPTKRASLWKTKRVFFVTPQVLEKDIQSDTLSMDFSQRQFVAGTCSIEYLVCLVIDEAHRALGNYSYSVAVREFYLDKCWFSVLFMVNGCTSATQNFSSECNTGISLVTCNRTAKQQAVQQVIDNLYISTLEYRNEDDTDVKKYVHNREVELIQVAMGQEAVEIDNKLVEAMRPFATRLCAIGVLPTRDVQTLSPCYLLDSREKFRQAPPDLPKLSLETLKVICKSVSFQLLIITYLTAETNDPQKSRQTYRDIMDALANIGNFVRATEFIGQSSGKALKGQSQKVQQAVLEHLSLAYLDFPQKFRAGGYNVIVATSIGEEGLDIMEVDLVICFDANVSPLRMIQRMGRTGRKHDGRVDILFSYEYCMFCSWLLIPHIFKPEVRFVEFSIEKFVHRGKKVIDDNTIQTPVIADKLTVAETTLIAKYFDPHEITWKPSLIAFPHFQTYPSRVYKVMHSHRTTMLIDMMQCLQGLTFSRASKISLLEDEICLKKCLGVDTAEQHDNNGEDFLNPDDSEVSPTRTLETEEKHNELNFPGENPYEHSYLFGSDVVTVDASGNVLVMVVPVFPWKDLSHSMSTSASIVKLDYLKQNSCHARTSDEDHTELTTEAGPSGDLKSTQITCMKNEISLKSRCCDSETWMEKSVSRVEKIPQTPILKGNLSNQGASVSESPDVRESKASLFLADKDNNFFRDGELSPRLTNLIKSGVVPESPIHNSGLSNNTDEYLEPDQLPVSPAQLHTGILFQCSSPGKSEKVNMRGNACGRNVSVSPVDNEIQTPLHNKGETASIRGCTSTSPITDRAQTVLADLTNNSSGKDWHLSSGDKLESVKQARKFKRLRKVGDHWKSRGESMTKNVGSTENPARSFSRAGPLRTKHDRGKKKSVDDVRVFIEEEAEVSSEADISDDEEDERDNYSNDSFIDDRINPTVAGTQFASGGIDMMAIYRFIWMAIQPYCGSIEINLPLPGVAVVMQTEVTVKVHMSHILPDPNPRAFRLSVTCMIMAPDGACPLWHVLIFFQVKIECSLIISSLPPELRRF